MEESEAAGLGKSDNIGLSGTKLEEEELLLTFHLQLVLRDQREERSGSGSFAK